MGKKRIIGKEEETKSVATETPKEPAVTSKRRISVGTVNVQATFNNTKILVADEKGNALFWSSSGSLGFQGAKKGTPYAATKVAELLADKAQNIGIRELHVVVRGVGGGREAAIRTFAGKGLAILSIRDATPIPHNGPRPKKPRRV